MVGDLRRLPADHQPRQRLLRLAARVDHRDDAAGAHHRAAAGQATDLVELVADEQHADALGRQPAQGREQRFGRLRRQHRGRFVEDQQFRLRQQRAQDLDPLPLAH
jgi:hypothetical protein